ncbi:HD-GYP domain-containing protein [Rhizobium sp. L1K21]|uniref:HD-GYP domain-containing protein n=1 Tax=Rhizobium sp. L1K21 TaxID=2954933 RepID=UPI0020938D9A|nr:HD domain-containing phosphohydrolase [Rhizobium sp. L1K21]MCO6187511.1 response regulator [Rhizobium sp. L1K21]
MKVLVLDDNKTSLDLLVKFTESAIGCTALPFASPAAALAAMPHLDFDVAVIDFQMPVYNGVEFLDEMMRFDKYTNVPVIFVTGDTDVATRITILDAGATDFITKPVDIQEFKVRLQNVLALSEARRELAEKLDWLQEAIDRGVLELKAREREIVHRLTISAGFKDTTAASHNLRVAAFAEAIARAYGLSDEECDDIRLAAPLHDFGGAASPDTSMLKQGRMTESAYRKNLRKNATVHDILAGSSKSVLALVGDIAACLNERWDGQGTPNRLKGDAIPLGARIVAVADVFDKLTTERPFKEAWPLERAAQHIRSRSGIQFDPDCVKAFEKAIPDIYKIMDRDQFPSAGIAEAS